MSVRPCPFCDHQTPRALDAALFEAGVNYYRCDRCGAVWNVPKDTPQGEPKVVVPSKRRLRKS